VAASIGFTAIFGCMGASIDKPGSGRISVVAEKLLA
jgi:hypothetical protein